MPDLPLGARWRMDRGASRELRAEGSTRGLRAKRASVVAALAGLVLGLNVASAQTPHDHSCNGSGNSRTVTGVGDGNGNGGTANGIGNGQGNLELVGAGNGCSQSASGTPATKQTPDLRVAISRRGRQVIAVVRLVMGAHGTVAVDVSRATLRIPVHHRGNRYTATVPAAGTWRVTVRFTGRQGWADQTTTRRIRIVS